ncbi:DUF4350 domain-containing protein [Microbulbifer hydrolyticus]|uniref:DUF4350 domain-containing protein n=1 Tax=Microbulbifer hydrolyticus TaxID=48074 RepID=A0A6P1T7Q2_9GAMM|nr:DUF4350 domain-containing protein [Microbulbifer hydrolyticus]MBB5211547.1 hypothetical protein [Microbulbifer hydrolyticus]QHQ37713.1 hypothetical protein GTQ55_01070 [Microbulbifer hydrolyticus]
MKLSRIAIVWGVLLLAAACALFLYFFERHTEEVDLGFGPEARRNPYLAAQRFLDRLDIGHRRADNISVITTLDDRDALFLASSSQIYNPDRLRELLDWVDAGGHAIVIAHRGRGDNEQDLLLEALELEVTSGDLDLYFNRQVREVFGEEASELQDKTISELMRDHNRKLDEKDSENTSGESPDSAEPDIEGSVSTPRNPDVDPERLVNLTSDSGPSYAIYFNPEKVFAHEMMGKGTDADVNGALLHWVPFQNMPTQSPLVYYERGRGRLTLMTDGGLWQNDRIGEFDHAYFLAHLVGDRELVMITRPRFDTLGTLIQRYALELFFAGLLALAAWIANRSRRFGPLTPPPAAERRSLLEHIRACGHFYWRQNRGVSLFDGARKPLLAKLGGNRNLNADRQRQIAESVAEKTGLAAREIHDTLWGPAPRNEDDFTARLRSIQIIEAAL